MKQIKSYQDAVEYLGGKKERPYANNTRIKFDSLELGHDVVTVTYHGNTVVTFFPEYTVFNSCGWKTLTTKERINWFLPQGFCLYQEKSVWYISDRVNHKTYVFEDGIAIDKHGRVSNAGSDDAEKQIKQQIKSIKAYVNGYVNALFNGEVEYPSTGDCWYCSMHTDDGKSLGDATNNKDHIESHIEESYYVPSMLYNALNERGSMFTKSVINSVWSGKTASDYEIGIAGREIKSSLTAYLKHALGIAQ